MNLRNIGSMLVLLPGLGACATITRGTHESYVIQSEPPGATASLSTGVQCVTPCALQLKRKNGFTVDIAKDGYEPVHATITSGISGGGGAAMAGNLVLGGLIGAVVDGTNGSMNDLKPNPLDVKLVPLSSDATSASTAPPKTGAQDTSTAPVASTTTQTPGQTGN